MALVKKNPLQEMHEVKSDLESDAIHRRPPEASAQNAVTKLLALRDTLKAEPNASPYVADLGRVLDSWASKMESHPTQKSARHEEPEE